MIGKRKRMTKGRLHEIISRNGGKLMPEIGTEVVESGDTVAQNIPYEIVNVEEVDTEISHYSGIRVEMLTAKGETGSIMLWKRQRVGTGSKLGVFITVLGTNTDSWLHRWVMFKNWEKNNRVIVGVASPSPASLKETRIAGAEQAFVEVRKETRKGGK